MFFNENLDRRHFAEAPIKRKKEKLLCTLHIHFHKNQLPNKVLMCPTLKQSHSTDRELYVYFLMTRIARPGNYFNTIHFLVWGFQPCLGIAVSRWVSLD